MMQVTVKNTGGKRTSSVVVQVFASLVSALPSGALPPPRRQLVGFERVELLAPGAVQSVSAESPCITTVCIGILHRESAQQY